MGPAVVHWTELPDWSRLKEFPEDKTRRHDISEVDNRQVPAVSAETRLDPSNLATQARQEYDLPISGGLADADVPLFVRASVLFELGVKGRSSHPGIIPECLQLPFRRHAQ